MSVVFERISETAHAPNLASGRREQQANQKNLVLVALFLKMPVSGFMRLDAIGFRCRASPSRYWGRPKFGAEAGGRFQQGSVFHSRALGRHGQNLSRGPETHLQRADRNLARS